MNFIRPIYETEANRQKQKELAERLAAQWSAEKPTLPPLTVRMCKRLYPVDAVFERDGRIVGLAEVKDRDFKFGGPFGGYPNFWLSAAKVTIAQTLAREMVLPCVLIAGFTDTVHFCDIEAYERDNTEERCPIVVWDGRYDRSDKADVEPLLAYSWSAFEGNIIA